jgi:hypothetical protein
MDDPDGAKVASHEYRRTTPQGEAISVTATKTGFYAVRIRSSDTPAENPRPSYMPSVTYRAPQTLENIHQEHLPARPDSVPKEPRR